VSATLGRLPPAAGEPEESATGVTAVVVASDIRLYRDGLVKSLARDSSLDVVADTATPLETLAAVRAKRVDVVLLDLAMTGSVELADELAKVVKVVVLGVREVEDEVIACAEAGAAGYVTRDASLRDLVEVVESVALGEMVCSPRIAALLNRRVAAVAGARRGRPPAARLTPRETEIVALIADGLSNKQIAHRLSIEFATVKNHVHHILEKLEVEGRADAAARVAGTAASARAAATD
jgi:two-component system nitrate/nitrite response regulator NarL